MQPNGPAIELEIAFIAGDPECGGHQSHHGEKYANAQQNAASPRSDGEIAHKICPKS